MVLLYTYLLQVIYLDTRTNTYKSSLIMNNKNQLTNVEKDLLNIADDIKYYKKDKDVIRFITRLHLLVVKNESEIYKPIIVKLINNLKNNQIKEQNLVKIQKIVNNFMKKSKI